MQTQGLPHCSRFRSCWAPENSDHRCGCKWGELSSRSEKRFMQSKLSQMTPRPLWLFKLHWGPGRNMTHLLAGNESVILKKYIFYYFFLSLFNSHLLYLKIQQRVKECVDCECGEVEKNVNKRAQHNMDAVLQNIVNSWLHTWNIVCQTWTRWSLFGA